jgi:hypothetical protein
MIPITNLLAHYGLWIYSILLIVDLVNFLRNVWSSILLKKLKIIIYFIMIWFIIKNFEL